MERSQTSKFWGPPGWGPSPSQQGLSPAPSEGRPYLEPGRTLPRVTGAGLAHQAGAEGGVPAHQRRREAARRLSPGRLPGQPGICGQAVPLAARRGRRGGAGRGAGLRRADHELPGVGTGTSAGRLDRDPTAGCRERSPALGVRTPPPDPRGSERVLGGDPGTPHPPSTHTCPGAGAHLSRGPGGGRSCFDPDSGARGPERRGRLLLVAQGDLPLQPQHLPLGLAKQSVEVPQVEPLGALLGWGTGRGVWPKPLPTSSPNLSPG